MENKYFTRSINEGTVKRTHFCSFDKTIKLEMIVVGSKKVMNYLIKERATATNQDEKKAIENAREAIISDLAGLRINGLPIVYEDLDKCFDSEEIMEVMAFINGSNMSIFGGEEASEKNA